MNWYKNEIITSELVNFVDIFRLIVIVVIFVEHRQQGGGLEEPWSLGCSWRRRGGCERPIVKRVAWRFCRPRPWTEPEGSRELVLGHDPRACFAPVALTPVGLVGLDVSLNPRLGSRLPLRETREIAEVLLAFRAFGRRLAVDGSIVVNKRG